LNEISFNQFHAEILSDCGPRTGVRVRARLGLAGLDFGNHENAGTDNPPHITSTAFITATVGQIYIYNPAATDPDNDPLTWDLPVLPAGMAIDPVKGTIAAVRDGDGDGESLATK
jgi:hypothetical protein